MLRVAIPMALLVGGLAARLTSQETPQPESPSAVVIARDAVSAKTDATVFKAARPVIEWVAAGQSAWTLRPTLALVGANRAENENENEDENENVNANANADQDRSEDAVEEEDEILEEALDDVEVELIVEEEIKRQVGEPPSATARAARVVAQIEAEATNEARASSSSDAAAPAADAAPATGWKATGKGERTIRIYQLNHVRAASAAGVIERLFAEDMGVIVPEERTNQLIVRAAPEVHDQIAEFLEALDRPEAGPPRGLGGMGIPKPAPSPPATKSADAVERPEKRKARADVVLRMHPGGGPARVALPPGHPHPQEHDVLILKHPGQGLAPHVELLLDHGHHELAILAERIRGLRAASPPDEKALAELEEQLRDRVAAAFDARQEAQRAEVAVLEQQLASIKQAIEQRDKERDELVEQRVDEWLSGAAVREPFEFRRRFEFAVPRPAERPVPAPGAPPLP